MAHLLIIDDNDAVRTVISLGLRKAGHSVTVATEGKQGIQLFKDNPADLVITDMVMPEQDGVETIRLLRGLDPALPIIAISGTVFGSRDYLDEANRVGANRIIHKPFSLLELVQAVTELLAGPPSHPATR